MPLPSSSIVSEIRTSSNCRTRSQPNAETTRRLKIDATKLHSDGSNALLPLSNKATENYYYSPVFDIADITLQQSERWCNKWTLSSTAATNMNPELKVWLKREGHVLCQSRELNWLSCFSPRPPANSRTPLWSAWHWHQTQTETLSEDK